MRYVNTYRFATVFGWLARFPDAVLGRDQRLLLVKAWLLGVSGRHAEAVEAIAAVERLGGLDEGPLPDGFSSVEASLSLAKAVAPWGDVGSQRAAARQAAELEQPGSPMWPIVSWAVGWGCYYGGEFDESDRWFAEGADRSVGAGLWTSAVAGLAYRSLMAGDRGQPEEQRRLVEQAEEIARAHGIDESSGTLCTALSASLGECGKIDEALAPAERGIALIRRRNVQVDLADALLRKLTLLRRLEQREEAAAVLAEVRAVVESCPDAGVLPARLAAFEQNTRERGAAGAAELSERELTVLRMLSGSLSERDIGRELYLSHNTVHSHVRSIYRKLGVFSRAEAVAHARSVGLL
jgi:LuxR family maltose regulon positive regulatory protein